MRRRPLITKAEARAADLVVAVALVAAAAVLFLLIAR